MKRTEKQIPVETISAVVVAITLVLSIVVASVQNSEAPLMPMVLLGLLYLSMVRKWKQLSKDSHSKATVSFVIHVFAMVLVVALMFYALAHV